MSNDKAKLYGEDAKEWLRRWDAGEIVHTIEMGGLGPGYEQCIHVTAAEVIRYLIENSYSSNDLLDKDKWPEIRDEIEKAILSNDTVKCLGGITGAQYGAAVNVGCMIYIHGPIAVMNDERVKDRHIQVQKHFPKGA